MSLHTTITMRFPTLGVKRPTSRQLSSQYSAYCPNTCRASGSNLSFSAWCIVPSVCIVSFRRAGYCWRIQSQPRKLFKFDRIKRISFCLEGIRQQYPARRKLTKEKRARTLSGPCSLQSWRDPIFYLHLSFISSLISATPLGSAHCIPERTPHDTRDCWI